MIFVQFITLEPQKLQASQHQFLDDTKRIWLGKSTGTNKKIPLFKIFLLTQSHLPASQHQFLDDTKIRITSKNLIGAG